MKSTEIRLVGQQTLMVARRLPRPGAWECWVEPVACTLCGSDLNTVAGHKDIGNRVNVRLGHELVGRVLEIGPGTHGLAQGDLVVLKPHQWVSGHDTLCPNASDPLTFRCQGRGCTTHAGFRWDGSFCTVGLFPVGQLVKIPQAFVPQGILGLPPAAVFSMVEPLACVRSASLLRQQVLAAAGVREVDGSVANSLILGAGPIGTLAGAVLLEEGCAEVVMKDDLAQRADIAVWALDTPRARRFGTRDRRRRFPLVIVTANSLGAILEAEHQVEPGGVIYLLSGLNPEGRLVQDRSGLYYYEDVHRRGEYLSAMGNEVHRTIAGHSGYAEQLFDDSIRWAAEHSATLNRMITHVIPSIDSPEAISRFPEVVRSWTTPDASPAVLTALRRAVPRDRVGMKTVLLP
ncbi:alcohol dehydrogenase catalytic domain-containing protein [Streptomyces sp. NPDC059720]|uniref:alcohol dehydrogenase catalytic domain-containing protein n=1 Tax=Streptomyces sp. NPDC059720 TaxID=3346924 RepID=UPI0036ACC75C